MPAHYLEIIVVVIGLILLLMEAFSPKGNKSFQAWIAIIGLVAVMAFTWGARPPEVDGELARMYNFDAQARFYKLIALLTTILVLFMSMEYKGVLGRFSATDGKHENTGEYFFLPIFICAGMMWMASARDLTLLFISLELVTIGFYVLVAFLKRNIGSLEAGVKYLILGALSTGLLVFGIAWIYGMTGSMHLDDIHYALATENVYNKTGLLFGLSFVLLGLCFKIGGAPMQGWIPDVYQGAPIPTAAFLSVGSKAAGFAITINILKPFLSTDYVSKELGLILAIIAGTTMIFGNLAAIGQNNAKRLLAYSSIAHAGFLLIALAAWSMTGLSSERVIGFYLATYLLMTMGGFFILSHVRQAVGSESFKSFDGLASRAPMAAALMTLFSAAMAGLPLTAGFWGKFFVFQLAIEKELWVLIIIAFLGVAAGFYYYFKFAASMFWKSAPSDESISDLKGFTLSITVILAILTILFGFWANPIMWLMGR